MKKKRIFALLLCAVLCAAIAFSYAFIALKSEHDCTGEHCSVCAELQICQSLIRNLSYAGAALAASLCIGHILIGSYRCFSAYVKTNTPVSFKVKLLN